MSPAYWIFLGSMAIGFRGGVQLWKERGRLPRFTALARWTVAAACLVWFIYHATWHLLRFWRIMTGMVLCVEVSQIIVHRDASRKTWSDAVESAGGLLALWLGSGDVVALLTGFTAGLALPFALDHWVLIYEKWTRVWGVVTLGGIGIKNLWSGLTGISDVHTPTLLWVVPWLILWDLWDRFFADALGAWPPKSGTLPRR